MLSAKRRLAPIAGADQAIPKLSGINCRLPSLAFLDGVNMAHYRLCFFRSQTGRIREVREFEAPHDFAAICQSAEWRANEAMELWCGGRKVTRWSTSHRAA